jgi:hypothetical protein
MKKKEEEIIHRDAEIVVVVVVTNLTHAYNTHTDTRDRDGGIAIKRPD